MDDVAFDQDGWLERIAYLGARAATFEVLRGLVYAHATAISYESIDVLLDRPAKLDATTLQVKMIRNRRGGYCFEQNMLFREGLRSLGFAVTQLRSYRIPANTVVD